MFIMDDIAANRLISMLVVVCVINTIYQNTSVLLRGECASFHGSPPFLILPPLSHNVFSIQIFIISIVGCV